jgi:archaemetzincin
MRPDEEEGPSAARRKLDTRRESSASDAVRLPQPFSPSPSRVEPAEGAHGGSLDFVTVGPFPPELAQDLVSLTSRRLPLPCRLLRGPGPTAPRIEGRDQLDADRLLAALEAVAAESLAGHVLMGLTAQDIGSPLFTFFFGRARLRGRAGLVSVARLAPTFYGLPDDPEITAHRAVIEILHEFGHVAGLTHCDDFGCLMHLTTNVEGLDARGSTYCEACLDRLPDDLRPHAPGRR